MTSGHRGEHKILPTENAELAQYMSDPRWDHAISRFVGENGNYPIAYLAGSNRQGTLVYYDRDFYNAIRSGRVLYDGRPFEPRPFLKVHETFEYVLIVLFGLDYAKAHRLATLAERHAVVHAGMIWDDYQEIFRPYIAAAEKRGAAGMPSDILLTPYKGTKLFAPLARAQLRMAS